MTVVSTAEVPVFPTFQGFRTAVVREVDVTSVTAGRTFGDRLGSAAKGVGKVIGTMIAAGAGVAAASVGAIFAKGFDRALNIQDAKKQLEGLGHSAESVDAIMKNALASVKGTSFGLDTAATIAATAVAAGVKPGQELERTLKLTADAATIAKVPLGEMGDIWGKVASSGKLSTDVVNQFSQRGVPLLQFVAKQYGVTADEASKMVSRGEVDFAAFQQAIETNIAGAALKSGQTARGAFANIGAAFGRMGAMFAQPAVDGAPTLFQSIAGAVDRASAALAPYAAQFATVLTPAIAALSGWVDKIDFGKIVAGIKDFYLSAVDVKDLLLTGFTENETLLPPSVVNGLQVAHDVFVKIGIAIAGVVAAFKSGDFSSLGGSFGEIGAVIKPMAPLFIELGKGLGGIAGSVGDVIAAGFPLLVPILQGFADVLNFLGENPALLAVAVGALGAAFVASKVAVLGFNVAAGVNAALAPARIAADLARTAALRANTAATLGQTVAERSSLGARVAGMATTIASTAANVAARVAMVAGSVATGVATAAQWAFNAALTANPIGLIIAAIVALVAGLIWFFTQTELGQEIWANFTRFLAEAWANIVAVATTVFTALADFFSTVWEGIVTFITVYINTVRAIIINVVNFIVTAWNLYWSTIAAVFRAIWTGISSFIGGIVGGISGAITGFVDGVRTNVENVVGFVSGLPGRILGFLGNLGSLLVSSGQSLIQGFIDGIAGMIGNVGKAIGGVMDFVAGFFPHSPAKHGAFAGAKWAAVKTSGLAIGKQLEAGLNASAPSLNAKLSALANGSVSVRSSSSTSATAATGSGARGPALQIMGDVYTTSVDEFFDEAERQERLAVAAAGNLEG